MLRYLFDTDHLTLFDTGHPLVSQRHASQPAGEVGISAVTVQEALRGRLAALARHRSGPMQVQAYANLVGTIRLFESLASKEAFFRLPFPCGGL